MDRATLKKTVEQKVLAQAQAFSEWKRKGRVYTFEEMEVKALEIAQEVAQALLAYEWPMNNRWSDSNGLKWSRVVRGVAGR